MSLGTILAQTLNKKKYLVISKNLVLLSITRGQISLTTLELHKMTLVSLAF